MADINDPQDFAGGLQRQRRLLAESTTVHDRDRDALEAWLRRKDGQVAVSSLKTYLRRVRVGSERSPRPLVELDEEGWHDYVFALRHDHGLADSTIQSYENAILMYLDDMTSLEWPSRVERTTVDDEGPTVDEILTPKDVQALVEQARHQRDVALIEFLADTGARLTLTLSLRVQDLSLAGDTPTYRPNPDAVGLKGATITDYPLIDSAAPLRSYLRAAHPRPNDTDVAVFHKLKPHGRTDDERWSDDGGLVANAARQQLKRIADRAGVDKPVHPHAFRHAAITRMVREGYSRSQIEHRVHWRLDTDMWEIYEHISSSEHNEDIFREAGILEDDQGPDRVRKNCGTCQAALAPHHDWCPNCGQPASPGAEDALDDGRDEVLGELVEATNPATRRELRALLDEIEARPDTARDGHEDPSS